jgi:hypothetical protein
VNTQLFMMMLGLTVEDGNLPILIRLPVSTRSSTDYPQAAHRVYYIFHTTASVIPVIRFHLNKAVPFPSYSHNYLVFPFTLCVIL